MTLRRMAAPGRSTLTRAALVAWMAWGRVRRPLGVLVPAVGGVVLAGISVPALAEATDAATIVKKVEAKYKDVHTIKADVVQVQRNELFGDETVKGELVVKRPSFFRWASGSGDDAKLFVSNGETMWIYVAEDKQVIVYDDVAGQSGSAQQFLTSMDKLGEKFDIQVLSSDASGHRLKLAPKEPDQFKHVEITLDPELLLQKVVIADTFDNVTEMRFSDLELNSEVDDAIFTFTPPAGVDVIEN